MKFGSVFKNEALCKISIISLSFRKKFRNKAVLDHAGFSASFALKQSQNLARKGIVKMCLPLFFSSRQSLLGGIFGNSKELTRYFTQSGDSKLKT